MFKYFVDWKLVSEAALFFCTYESLKTALSSHVHSDYAPYIHMAAASIGETVSIEQNAKNEFRFFHKKKFYPGGLFDTSAGRNRQATTPNNEHSEKQYIHTVGSVSNGRNSKRFVPRVRHYHFTWSALRIHTVSNLGIFESELDWNYGIRIDACCCGSMWSCRWRYWSGVDDSVRRCKDANYVGWTESKCPSNYVFGAAKCIQRSRGVWVIKFVKERESLLRSNSQFLFVDSLLVSCPGFFGSRSVVLCSSERTILFRDVCRSTKADDNAKFHLRTFREFYVLTVHLSHTVYNTYYPPTASE